jgi:hypothetical protein
MIKTRPCVAVSTCATCDATNKTYLVGCRAVNDIEQPCQANIALATFVIRLSSLSGKGFDYSISVVTSRICYPFCYNLRKKVL